MTTIRIFIDIKCHWFKLYEVPFKSLHKLYSQHSTFLGRSVISLNATPRSGPKWLSVQLLVVVEVGHLLPFLWCGGVDLCLCTKLGLRNNCKRAAASVVADDVCPVGVGKDCLLHCTTTSILQYLQQAWPKTFNYSWNVIIRHPSYSLFMERSCDSAS